MQRHLSLFRLSLLFLLGLAPNYALAERSDAANFSQWIVQMGQVGFSQGGGAYLPSSVLQAMYNGQVPLIQQYAVVNNMFNQCMVDIEKYRPSQSDSYQVAKSKFQYAMCRLQACQQQGLLILALPLLSDNPAAGGASTSASQAANEAMVTGLAQGFANTASCSGSGSAMDSLLLQILLQN